MRVLVAGASGAIGRRLVAALHARGDAVAGVTRDPKNADLLSALGALSLSSPTCWTATRPPLWSERPTGCRGRSTHCVAAQLHTGCDARDSGRNRGRAHGRWLPTFARYLGAPSPRRVPTGPDTVPDGRFYAELLRGAANQLARKELGLDPRPLPRQ